MEISSLNYRKTQLTGISALLHRVVRSRRVVARGKLHSATYPMDYVWINDRPRLGMALLEYPVNAHIHSHLERMSVLALWRARSSSSCRPPDGSKRSTAIPGGRKGVGRVRTGWFSKVGWWRVLAESVGERRARERAAASWRKPLARLNLSLEGVKLYRGPTLR